MKNPISPWLLAAVLAGAIPALMSYRTTDGEATGGNYTHKVIIPLKQRNVVVTESYNYMRELLAKGYVCEDVDLIYGHATAIYEVRKYYTMVKY